MKKCIALFLPFLLLSLNLSSFARESPSFPIQISAEEIQQIKQENKVTAKGEVEIIYQEARINASEVILNTETGKGVAQGEVVFSDRDNLITCERAEFNLQARSGTMYKARGYTATEFFFQAEKVEKAAADRYEVEKAVVTTCAEENPFWKIKVREGSIRLKKYAYLKHPTFWIKKVPIFYLPYLIVPVNTKRATGFLFPAFGSSTKDGLIISPSFFWAINQQSDSTLTLDYLSRKGIRPGLEYRYTPRKDIRGKLRASYLREKGTKREFYQLSFKHRQRIEKKTLLQSQLDVLSRNNPEREFGDNLAERSRRQTDSYFSLTRNRETRSLQFLVRDYKTTASNSSFLEFARLPVLSFKNQKERLGETPLFWEMDSVYSSFLKKEEGGEERVERLHLFPRFSLALLSLPYLSIVPEAGISETYYSRTKKGSKGFWRNLYQLSIFLEGPKFSRIYSAETKESPKYKHLIEPRFSYHYIAPWDQDDQTRLISLDGLEQRGSSQTLNSSLINRILKKGIKGKIREILRLEIKGDYQLNNREEKAFSNLRIDLDSKISESLNLNLDAAFNPYRKKTESLNLELGWEQAKLWSVLLNKRYRGKELTKSSLTSSYLGAALEISLYKNLSLKYITQYNEQTNEFLENNYGLDFSFPCWGFSLNFVQRKLLIANLPQKETKFYFRLNFKGLGTIGFK